MKRFCMILLPVLFLAIEPAFAQGQALEKDVAASESSASGAFIESVRGNKPCWP